MKTTIPAGTLLPNPDGSRPYRYQLKTDLEVEAVEYPHLSVTYTAKCGPLNCIVGFGETVALAADDLLCTIADILHNPVFHSEIVTQWVSGQVEEVQS